MKLPQWGLEAEALRLPNRECLQPNIVFCSTDFSDFSVTWFEEIFRTICEEIGPILHSQNVFYCSSNPRSWMVGRLLLRSLIKDVFIRLSVWCSSRGSTRLFAKESLVKSSSRKLKLLNFLRQRFRAIDQRESATNHSIRSSQVDIPH